MAVISFWNNNKVDTGNTFSMAAISTLMAIEHNYKILLISTKYRDDTLESCFWEQAKPEKGDLFGLGKKIDLDTGIEGICKALKSNKLSPELISNYTKTVFKGRLEVLSGTTLPDEEENYKIKKTYKEIIKIAKQYYDLIFIDLDKGLEDESTREILEESDLILISMIQNLKQINSYIQLKSQDLLFSKPNVMLLLGKYDKYSKYTLKNIEKYVGTGENFVSVPYNTLFFEACNEGKIVDYFIKLRKISETDRNAIFIKYVTDAKEQIIYTLKKLHITA